MRLKRKIIAAALAASTMLLCSADAFAGVNYGNGDGSDFKHGTEDNGWLLKKDNGSNIYRLSYFLYLLSYSSLSIHRPRSGNAGNALRSAVSLPRTA